MCLRERQKGERKTDTYTESERKSERKKGERKTDTHRESEKGREVLSNSSRKRKKTRERLREKNRC